MRRVSRFGALTLTFILGRLRIARIEIVIVELPTIDGGWGERWLAYLTIRAVRGC
jgi:hypothetical protein